VLGKSRKPYVVLDASQNRMRVALLGLTVRDIPLGSVEISGLLRADKGHAAAPLGLDGIVTLKEKEGDPRQKPLTPADIEAGAADENVADALAPEAPADYELRVRQPAQAGVEGVAGRGAGWLGVSEGW